MKIVVTGGAGYIGSVAVQRLVSRGDAVIVVDNLWQGHRAAVAPDARFVAMDIRDGDALRALLREARPDAVMHFAALTIAPESVGDPGPYWATNCGGTLALLEAMREIGQPALVFSSTAAVYGTPSHLPITEAAPVNPINPYGASKLAAERAIESYSRAYGIPFAVLRYFNVAGATADLGEDHSPETHLIPRALDAAAGRQGPLPVFGTDFATPDGTAVRDYVHVEDLIDAHLAALDRLVRRGCALGALNLGTRDGASVRQILAAVADVLGRPVPVTYADRRPGDPPSLVADASRARELLDWSPSRSTLPAMIASAWAWREQHPFGYADLPHPGRA